MVRRQSLSHDLLKQRQPLIKLSGHWLYPLHTRFFIPLQTLAINFWKLLLFIKQLRIIYNYCAKWQFNWCTFYKITDKVKINVIINSKNNNYWNTLFLTRRRVGRSKYSNYWIVRGSSTWHYHHARATVIRLSEYV